MRQQIHRGFSPADIRTARHRAQNPSPRKCSLVGSPRADGRVASQSLQFARWDWKAADGETAAQIRACRKKSRGELILDEPFRRLPVAGFTKFADAAFDQVAL